MFAIFSLIGVSLLMFIIVYTLPGDPATAAAGPGASPEQIEYMRQKLGLDKPLYQQYARFVWRLLHGDLGISTRTHRPVTTELKERIPASFELVFAAMLFLLLVSIPLGVFSALKPGGVIDAIGRIVVALGMGMPIFWVGLVAQMILVGKLHLFPFGNRLGLTTLPPPSWTGFYVIDSLLSGDWATLKEAVYHLILPAIILALPELAVTTRLVRSSMLEVLDMDYVRTARAKGLPERTALWKHALRNALIAPVTILGLQFGWMLGNTILIERIFCWGGIGYFAVSSIYNRDFPMLNGIAFVMCLVFVVGNTIVDILYLILDPRVKY